MEGDANGGARGTTRLRQFYRDAQRAANLQPRGLRNGLKS